jgi:nucleoside diphosphate kinase
MKIGDLVRCIKPGGIEKNNVGVVVSVFTPTRGKNKIHKVVWASGYKAYWDYDLKVINSHTGER